MHGLQVPPNSRVEAIRVYHFIATVVSLYERMALLQMRSDRRYSEEVEAENATYRIKDLQLWYAPADGRGRTVGTYRTIDISRMFDRPPMDAVQQSFYILHFKAAFHEKKGTAFQDWFVQLAGHAHGADFEEVRPYGKQGDLKCDGRLVSVGAIFQVYAPYLMKESDLNAKVKEDFEGAVVHWDAWLKTWIFVHNDARGLPPGVVQYLDLLRSQNPKVKIEVWSEPELLSLLRKVDLAAHQLMFGYAPSLAVVDRLAMQDLVPIIEALSRAEPSVTDPPLTPPSLQKLERNSLSSDAAVLLQMGRRKSDLVRTFFARGSRPDLGEHIAQAFREHYQTLKGLGLSADSIFRSLQDYAGGNGDPQRQGAALAVVTYFFDACDIFEDPSETVATI